MCHLGICLDSIYITADGKWKIAGLNYTQQITTDQEQNLDGDFYDYAHCAPEVVRLNKFNKYSDSFSLGILFINFMLILKKSYQNLIIPV